MPDDEKEIIDTEPIDFDMPRAQETIIKAIGVGGGGGNAVSHMYRQGIEGVSFAVCNTDSMALNDSPVPVKVQMGEGLGAGSDPKKGCAEAEKSVHQIRRLLSDGTKMIFITAGMGGGTGTGASPVIARVAREMGILTVGIVTIPFAFEGIRKIDQALDGVEKLSSQVDALLVVNNERLREIYQDLSLLNAFAHADDTLTVAAQSIVELVHKTGRINVDFEDAKRVLKDGGVAIISTACGTGPHRVAKAIETAITSPLINDKDIYNSQKILLNIYSSGEADHTLGVDEMADINSFMSQFKQDYDYKWGFTIDPSLGDKVKVTILASGFGLADESYKDRKKRKDDEQERERQAYLDRRREQYYRDNGHGKKHKPFHRVFVFNPDDLDCDDVIEQIEAMPVYSRNSGSLKDVRPAAVPYESASMPAATPADDGASKPAVDTGKPQEGVINFIE